MYDVGGDVMVVLLLGEISVFLIGFFEVVVLVDVGEVKILGVIVLECVDVYVDVLIMIE